MGDNAGHIPFRISKLKVIQLKLNTKPLPVKLEKIKFFIVIKEELILKKPLRLIVNGFSKEVLNKLPMEFAVEAQKLLEISLEGSGGIKNQCMLTS